MHVAALDLCTRQLGFLPDERCLPMLQWKPVPIEVIKQHKVPISLFFEGTSCQRIDSGTFGVCELLLN